MNLVVLMNLSSTTNCPTMSSEFLLNYKNRHVYVLPRRLDARAHLGVPVCEPTLVQASKSFGQVHPVSEGSLLSEPLLLRFRSTANLFFSSLYCRTEEEAVRTANCLLLLEKALDRR
eukprot:GHVU01092211.1.p2 GENE.GHVU01092211.1~~GHVU01092211.1.p2  ORF type:complete len:117 (+),score=7.13 GHVU01092211.1:533-883(+)